MSTPVIALRIVSLLAFAGPMMLAVTGRRGKSTTPSPQRVGDQAPLVPNLAAVAVYLPSLLVFSSTRPVHRRCYWRCRDYC